MNKNQYLENVAMALGTLRAHKMRSFLTVLGVIIGVLTVIVIASILTGMRSSIVSLVEQYGTHNVWAFHLTTGPQTGPRDRQEWQRKPLTVDDAEAIRQNADAVSKVGYFGFFFGSSTLKYEDKTFSRAQIQGVSPSLADVNNLALAEGRFFSRVDDLRRNNVAILGVNVVEALFPNYASVVGKVVELEGKRFTVVGVLEKRKASFFGSNDEDNVMYIPYRTLRKISPRSDFLLIISAAKEGQLERAQDQIEAVLRRQRNVRFDEPNNFDLTTSDRLIQQFDSITATIGLVAIAISGVGLLVGGIGVMNIMLVSVTERTREIGVRKAIGAKRRDIVSQFLFEAITLSTSGGVLGIVLAVITSYILAWLLPDMPSSIPSWAVITGFVVSLSVGLIFGVWPAVKASKLDPIESLRYE
ncbi:MAG: ABC transporter permease [Acidobacteriota bacterium]|nr:MAG: ABC transporter permease [Acidobacteriota bacterium]